MQKYAVWFSSGVVTLVLLLAGYRTLSGDPVLHTDFINFGLPPQFGYFIGAFEIVAAILIWIPGVSFLAASGACVVACSILLLDPPLTIGIPAALVALISVYVAIRRKPQAFWLR